MRCGVSRPRNQRASVNATPTPMENTPWLESSVRVEHQYVPEGVSVYWANAVNWLGWSKTVRPDHLRQEIWPSIAPVWSVGNASPLFS